RTFDAENRIKSATDSSNNTSSYVYDGDGKRIKRIVGTVETWQVYGLGGELLAEYPANGAPLTPQKEYGYRNGELLVTADASQNFNGYGYRRTITIDHAKVPNTDQSNFPLLIKGTYSYLATTANGGDVRNATGYDVVFTSDSGCSIKLNHEVESYDATTGSVNYWVKIPAVSHTSDTTVYMCYGNPGISTDQSNKTGVWDSNYKAVYHLPNGTTLSTSDSTSNGNNGTQGSSAAAGAGKINGGQSVSAAENQYIAVPTNSGLRPTSLTLSAWLYTSANDYNRFAISEDDNGSNRNFSLSQT